MIPLVVGGDGLIGSALTQAFESAGTHVLSTTRRRGLVGPTRPWLDLEERPEQWEPPVEVAVAYLCAGETRVDVCTKNPADTARMNVHGVMTFATRLHSQGTRVVFLSTNQVFDGAQPHAAASDAPNPATEYGRQKARVEKALLSLGDGVTVVRLTKVLGPANSLLTNWHRRLRSGNEIRPFSDMVVSPISLALTVQALIRIGSRHIQGVVQCSGASDVSYFDIGLRVASVAGASPVLVRPMSIRDSEVASGFVPRFTTLDTFRMRTELELASPEWQDVVDQAIDRCP